MLIELTCKNSKRLQNLLLVFTLLLLLKTTEEKYLHLKLKGFFPSTYAVNGPVININNTYFYKYKHNLECYFHKSKHKFGNSKTQ